ncbi:MAG TPA: aminotransferase class I/II-fold pyridoxal phosphate-dependent enzyme [Caulobacteraceae bacterium]|jgi:dTDP-4-amino-4,6-dideoxygalactose transaminase|nr:aminotransferase class I/II-fold pyridoxal phosphate-dependent enzyme [Caulobacteraceae bacterium]
MGALKRKPAAHAAPRPDITPSQALVPIARPRLPTRAAIAPYLDRIDEARWYSNYGPLVRELEARLAARLGDGAAVATVANGTVALTLALQAAGARPGTLCLMPAWTFVATAHAAIVAGLTPYFVDVDPQTWMLDPAATRDAIAAAPAEVGAVMPVAAFGRVPDLAAWRELADATGLPVIVDGAAAFDALRSAPVPVTVSLHATKGVAAGEGGYVACEDPGFVEKVRALAAFGFHGSRISQTPATNAKISEYAAAVALASLDAWPADRARFALTAQRLRAALALTPEISFQPGWGSEWVSSVCVVATPDGAAAEMARAMAAAKVETRDWWGAGCHRHPAFAHCPRAPLRVTDQLAAATLGLPYFIDLGEDDCGRIIESLHQALKVAHG